MNPNPFNKQGAYDLGEGTRAVSKADVDKAFLTATSSTSKVCIVCQQPAIVRIYARKASYNTAEIEDRGYSCQYHTSAFDSTLYELRRLDSSSQPIKTWM